MWQISPFATIIHQIEGSIHKFTLGPLIDAQMGKKWFNGLPLHISQIGWVRSSLLAHISLNKTYFPVVNTAS